MSGTLLVFLGAFAYFLLFRFYGFQVEDEGTLLFQLSRVAEGQFPYVDFHTGYTPGFFYVGSHALRALGTSTATLRPAIALVNATSVAGLYALGRRVAGPWMALVGPLAWLAFLPVYREFAAFNVPYPAWLATLAWVAAALASTHWVRRGGHSPLVAAGLAAATAFSVKPNAGAFALAATTWLVALTAARRAALDRLAATLASLVMLLGVWIAFGLGWWSVDALVHLAPVTVIALTATFILPARLATSAHPRAVSALGSLAAGFLLPTLLWVVPVLQRLGPSTFARDVLLLGSPAAALYYLPHPPPQFYAVAVVIAALTVAVTGRAVAHGRLTPALPLIAGLVAAVVIGARLYRSALMPEALASSLTWQLENAGYWLAPLAHWGGIAYLFRARRYTFESARGRTLLALVPLATAMYLQLYPRTDGMHLVMAVPLTAVLASALLERVLGWWTRHPARAGASTKVLLHTLAAAAVVMTLLARLSPALDSWWQSHNTPLLIETPTVAARAEPEAADDLAAFGAAANFLRRHTTPGEPALAFPALTGLLFASGLRSPVPHDYWYPGRPDHDDEAAMVARLRTAPPRFIATLNDGWTFFIESPPYFLTARAFATESYALVARFGRYDILARRDVAAGIVPEAHQPRGPATAALEPDLGRRRQAVRRWMAGLSVGEAAHAVLDDDPRVAVLRLRAIRDGGDVRTAGWLVAGYRSPNPRVREEALGAMYLVTAGLGAARYRWANDFDPAFLRPYVAPYLRDAEALRTAPEPRARDFAEALLALTRALDTAPPESE